MKRTTYIPALTAMLLLAAPFCAAMWHPAGGGGRCGSESSGPSYGAPPRFAMHGYASPYADSPRFAVPQAVRPGYGAPFSMPMARRAQLRDPGPHRGDWLRHTMQLPPEEQYKRLQADPHFRQLPPQRQQELMHRLQRFNSLPPEERQRILNRMEMVEHMPPAQRREAHQLFHQFRAMPPQRRALMHRTLIQMRAMPPYARERFLNSPLTASHFTPQEMQMLRGFNSLGFINEQH